MVLVFKLSKRYAVVLGPLFTINLFYGLRDRQYVTYKHKGVLSIQLQDSGLKGFTTMNLRLGNPY